MRSCFEEAVAVFAQVVSFLPQLFVLGDEGQDCGRISGCNEVGVGEWLSARTMQLRRTSVLPRPVGFITFVRNADFVAVAAIPWPGRGGLGQLFEF